MEKIENFTRSNSQNIFINLSKIQKHISHIIIQTLTFHSLMHTTFTVGEDPLRDSPLPASLSSLLSLSTPTQNHLTIQLPNLSFKPHVYSTEKTQLGSDPLAYSPTLSMPLSLNSSHVWSTNLVKKIRLEPPLNRSSWHVPLKRKDKVLI